MAKASAARVDQLGSLLDRIGSELDDLAGRLGRLSFAGAGSPAPDEVLADELTALQDIDIAWQTLQCLATVMKRAAGSSAASALVDVDRLAAGLPLEAVTRLVNGEPAACPLAQGGDLDLF